MEALSEIRVTIIDVRRYNSFFLPYFLGGTALTLGLGLGLHSAPILCIGGLLFFLGPVVLNNTIREPFSRDAYLYFFPDRLRIESQSKKTWEYELEQEFPYAEVAGYRSTGMGKDGSVAVLLRMRDGREFRYTFTEWSGEGTPFPPTVFDKQISAYNDSQPEGHRVEFLLDPEATPKGWKWMIGFFIVLVIALVLAIIYAPAPVAAVVGFCAFLLFFIVAFRRDEAIRMYKKMNKVDGRSDEQLTKL